MQWEHVYPDVEFPPTVPNWIVIGFEVLIVVRYHPKSV